MFGQILKSFLAAKSNTQIEVITSFDEEEEDKIFKSQYALMIISSDYYQAESISNELGLLKKMNQKDNLIIFRLIFTSDESGFKNDGVSAINHKFYLDDPFAHIDLSTEEGYFAEKAFWLKLVDLSRLIVPEKEKSKHLDYKIFMAEPTPDILQEWESVKRELSYLGYEIISLPEIKNQSELNQYTLEGFEKSNLIIHMIGGEAGQGPDRINVAMEQNSLAASYCEKTGMNRRLIWLPDTLIIKNELQRIAIEKMKRDNKALTGAEIIQTTIESFKSILQQRIQTAEEQTIEANIENRAYLIYPPQLEKQANKLVDSSGNLSLDFIHPLKSNNKSELLKHHWQSLLACNAVFLFYTPEQKDWLRSKIKDIIKVSGFGRKKPIEKKILVVMGNEMLNEQDFSDFKIVDIGNMSETEQYLSD
jgi:hypothetical protein